MKKHTLFLGTLLTKTLQEGLEENNLWRESAIDIDGFQLEETSFSGKAYVGIFIEDNPFSFDALQSCENVLAQKLCSFSPHVEDASFVLFTQCFIG